MGRRAHTADGPRRGFLPDTERPIYSQQRALLGILATGRQGRPPGDEKAEVEGQV